MTIQPGEAVPGGLPGPEAALPPAVVLVPSPLEVAQNTLHNALSSAQRLWAPGRARATWNAWNATPERYSDVPTLVRVGHDISLGAPALVPLLGEGHIVLGDQENTRVQKPAPVPSGTPLASRSTVQKQNQYDAVVENDNRLKRVGVEHPRAVGVATGLMTRSIGSMNPGAVRLSLYDSHSLGHDFGAFSALAEHKPSLFDVSTQPNELSALLAEIVGEIRDTNARMLRGYPSMRALVEAGHDLPKPWRVVTLLGTGEQLNARDSQMLRQVMAFGADCGISLVVHGFDVGPEPPAENIWLYMDEYQLERNRYAMDPQRAAHVHGRDITLDLGPANHLIAATSTWAANDRPRPTQNGRRGDIPSQQAYQQSLPSVRYRGVVADHERRVADADAAMEAFYARSPFLHPTVLQHEITPSREGYVQMAARAAASGWRAFKDVWRLFGQNSKATEPQQLQAWAAMDLLRHAPGNRLATVASTANSAHAESLIRHNLEAVADLVGVTARHGHGAIPADLRDYVAQYLHEEPPAWAFQIVFDEILASHWRVRTKDSIRHAVPRQAIDAICLDLEATYGVRLREGEDRHIADQNYMTCLAQCRLLELYNFNEAPTELRTLLVRRVHRDIGRYTADQLPEQLRGLHAAVFAHLEAIGGPILTTKEKLGKAASGVGALLTAKETAKEDAEPEAGR